MKSRAFFVGGVLAILSAIFCCYQLHRLGWSLWSPSRADYWFDSDSELISKYLSTHFSLYKQRFISYHLAFYLFSKVAYQTLWNILMAPTQDIMVMLSVFHCFVWTWLVFHFFSRLCTRLTDAILFTVLARVSAAGVFFLPTAESFVFGSSTVLLAFSLIEVRPNSIPNRLWKAIGLSLLTYGGLVTNAAIGIAATFLSQNKKNFVKITLWASGIFIVLLTLTLTLSSFSQGYDVVAFEKKWLFSANLWDVGKVFFFKSLIFPDSQYMVWVGGYTHFSLSIQGTSIFPTHGMGRASVLIWAVILIRGSFKFFTGGGPANLKKLIIFTLIWNFLVCWMYGTETFLYAINWIPILLTIAVLQVNPDEGVSFFTQCGLRWSLVAFTVLVGWNNLMAFEDCREKILAHSIPIRPDEIFRVDEVRLKAVQDYLKVKKSQRNRPVNFGEK